MRDRKLADPVEEHRKKAAQQASLAVITLSTTRSASNDTSGDVIQSLLERGGHRVVVRKVIADNRTVLRATLRELVRQRDVQAIVTTGGTGLAMTDITIETVRGMFDKEMAGFTSLFMLLSYPEVKSASMLSRTTAGTIKGKPVFCLPGSPRACKLAVELLILPELGHILMLVGG
jgi:molybdenum cofactor biosynthesis protein B